MSGVKTTHTDGDVAVGRNTSIGGNAIVYGDAILRGNVKIEGWLNADNVVGAQKGLFLTEARLKEVYPQPDYGWTALVGNSIPAMVYVVENGEWVSTGQMGGVVGVPINEFAHTFVLQTKKISHGLDGNQFDFATVLQGVSDEQLIEMQDTTKWRFVLLTYRKHKGQGRRWRIPMLPYLQGESRGAPYADSSILEQDTWWPVSGRVAKWFRDSRTLVDAISMHVSPQSGRFSSTKNRKKPIGVALFKYVGGAGEGWVQVSNTAYIELYNTQSKGIVTTVRE